MVKDPGLAVASLPKRAGKHWKITWGAVVAWNS